jgi:hypothetical protein
MRIVAGIFVLLVGRRAKRGLEAGVCGLFDSVEQVLCDCWGEHHAFGVLE